MYLSTENPNRCSVKPSLYSVGTCRTEALLFLLTRKEVSITGPEKGNTDVRRTLNGPSVGPETDPKRTFDLRMFLSMGSPKPCFIIPLWRVRYMQSRRSHVSFGKKEVLITGPEWGNMDVRRTLNGPSVGPETDPKRLPICEIYYTI